jgi:hypothetical protein
MLLQLPAGAPHDSARYRRHVDLLRVASAACRP